MLPDLAVAEIHRRGGYLSVLSVLPNGIHHQAFVGACGLLARNERTEVRPYDYLVAAVIIDRSRARPQLVDLPAIEVKNRIDLVVACTQVVTPALTMQVSQVDITLERLTQTMGIRLRVLRVGVHQPFGTDAIGCIILQTTIAEVVEQGQHTALVRTADVVLYGLLVTVARQDILPLVHRIVGTASQRMMVLPVPVLELQVVDMVATEDIEHGIDLRVGHITERGEESVTREAAGFGADINADRGYHAVLAALGHEELCHITAEILVGRLPCPCG